MRRFFWLPHKRAWLNLDQVVLAEYDSAHGSERLRVETSGPHAVYVMGEDAELLDAALDMHGDDETETTA